jgi:NIMA (never in mitosis gene a)-related kinase
VFKAAFGMGAASGAYTIGTSFDAKTPLGSIWGDGLNDLEVHGYEAVKEISVSSHAAVLIANRRGWSDQKFVVKAFASCNADELTKNEGSPLQEAMLLRGLEHPNIVKYVEAWWTSEQVTSGRLSLVMEYAEDGDLHAPRLAMRKQSGCLAEVVIGRWLRQILDALAYLHGKGVVHRDLKTSNVFLKDSWSTALIGDFGISTVLARSTFAKNCAGTPAYMSPEAVRSERFNTAVDIWSVGIILYELMTLELPFLGSLVALIYKICCSDISEAPLRERGYSEQLITLIRRILLKDATARPTATDLLYHEFWSTCRLDESEGAAHTACAASRTKELATGVANVDMKASFGSVETGVPETLPVLQSWASSDPTWAGASTMTGASSHGFVATPLHGPLSPAHYSDSCFFNEEDNVLRSSRPETPLAPLSMDLQPPSVEIDADEALRLELHAAHADGRVLSSEYLESLLARLGA